MIEINMAVFVMAVGILSMVVLYPLGLRESIQGRADLRQSMFADFVLNQAIAAASQTNITWSQWQNVQMVSGTRVMLNNSVPSFIKSRLDIEDAYPQMDENIDYRIACCRIRGVSDRIMGIMVQSTDVPQQITKYEQITNNPIYYAEVMFQGVP